MRIRRGPATVTGEQTSTTAREPGTPVAADDPGPGSRGAASPRIGRERSPGVPAAVHVRHRPAHGARVAAPPAAWPTRPAPPWTTCPPCSTASTSSSCASSAAAAPGRTGWTRCSPAAVPVVVLGGEQAPDAELMKLSTVPAGVAAEAHAYLAQGGPANLGAAARLPLRHGAADRARLRPARRAADWGVLERDAPRPNGRPDRRRPLLPGPPPRRATPPSSRRSARRIEDAGGRPLPVFCASLRQAEPALLRELRTADALVVTVLAAGGTKPATPRRAATTRRGTSASSPTSTCRSCRVSA